METTTLWTWKQSPRRIPAFGLRSADEIAADSAFVGLRWALASVATSIAVARAANATERVGPVYGALRDLKRSI